jgi:hypothetical protein
MKEKRISKKIALSFIGAAALIVLILPVIFDMLENNEKIDIAGTTIANASAGSEKPDQYIDTESEQEDEIIDPNLSYYAYLDEEFRRFGFVNGDRIFAETEADTAFYSIAYPDGYCTRTAIDLSGENVPFDYAYRYEISAKTQDFWNAAAEFRFRSDKTLKAGDIIAGCMYVRDAGGPNPAEFYIAVKTPTNNWAGEGNFNIHHYELEPGNPWRKIYFYGQSECDEDPASVAAFLIFLGFEPHTVDIGGVYLMRYPGTAENHDATWNMR